MRLALGSAAAPDLALPELLAVCERRGIEGVELVSGHAHGVAPGLAPGEVARLRRELAASPVRLVALYLADAHLDDALEMARLAVAFGAPLVAPVEIATGGVLPRVATLVAAEGGRLLLRHGTDEASTARAAEIAASLGAGAVGLAWELHPRHDDPVLVAGARRRVTERLRYVRFHGGGPEAAEQEGAGVGALMTGLALGRYTGPLVLTPGTPRYHVAWRAWLGRAGGWGCGSKTRESPVLSLLPR